MKRKILNDTMRRRKKKTPFPNDRGYKVLLKMKSLFMELLESFVYEEWVKEIDKKSMTRINTSFIIADYEGKEADLAYRLKINGKDVIFYVLMELQSTVHFSMPFRLLIYMMCIWLEVIGDKTDDEINRKSFRLPPIVPIVLYNGSQEWTAFKSFKEMLIEYEQFGEFVPDFKYILIDVNRYTKDDLIELKNTIGSVFLLDQDISKEEFIERVSIVVKILYNISKSSKRKVYKFEQWFNNIAIRDFADETKTMMSEFLSRGLAKGEVGEVGYMLRVFENVKAKAIEEGIEKGIEKGERQKAIDVARNMLLKGFDINTVAEITRLALDEVKKLKFAAQQ